MSKKPFVISILVLLVIVAGASFYILNNKIVSEPKVTVPKRVSILLASDLQLVAVDGLKEGLKEFGYIEGKDVVIDVKNPKGDRDLTKTMAAEIVASKPDLVVSVSTSASSAIKDADKEAALPVVFADVGNFKELGIENIQHPGGFMTGVVVDNVPAAPKRMEILKTLLPGMKRVGILVNNKHVSYNEILKTHEDGAKKLGLKITWYNVTKKEEVSPAMVKFIADKPDAFMTTSEATISGNAPLIAPVLRKAKIPSIDFNFERGVSSGYLMVYGVGRFDTGKQAARIIDKVLKGEKPGNIPVEFASSLKFEINAAMAEEMGIKIPESLLLQANKVYR
ncbi:hypothetical protein A3I94_00910 [Candidatus Giovannonibacteria bacterium RIFCSPLOWO2_02_FULL_43_54]|nr:MAG: hypothetical protein A3I94_00910 [Candidatus Giovannonibacteria bacterium RIFCSPLOWO2_02_FULL_43_54]OGF97290.1 MAG: hypothetical protein A3H08_00695 [Candidatus Giovannonibacteria bacterium RIFCSPLOWO2_12_FULL_44_32]